MVDLRKPSPGPSGTFPRPEDVVRRRLVMSDMSGGPGWWMASDGKWYPPTAAPAPANPYGSAPGGATDPPGRKSEQGLWARFRSLSRIAQAASWTAAVLVALIIIGAAAGSSKSHSTPISASGSSSTARTTTPSTNSVPATSRAPATTRVPVTAPPTTEAPTTVTRATAPVPPPVTDAPTTLAPVPQVPVTPAPTAPTAPPASAQRACTPLTNGGNCYSPGEYCRTSDHGVTGVAGNGESIVCAYNNGWRWEPAG
jgi:hypothetical protein